MKYERQRIFKGFIYETVFNMNYIKRKQRCLEHMYGNVCDSYDQPKKH